LVLLKEALHKLGIAQAQIIALNFESFATEPLKNAQALYRYLQDTMQNKQKYFILLDEIQEVTDWEKVVNSLLVDYDVDVYLTGSNSHLLSSELTTLLAGRYVEIPIYTLSYREFLDFKKFYFPNQNTSEFSFVEYLRKGGFPVHTSNYDEESVYKVIQDIYASVILRDTVQRYKIRNIELLERVIRFAFDNIGSTFSGKNIADYFKS
jgi:hypothetical protein